MDTFLGVDIGGTFTDLVWHDPASGEVVLGKGPTDGANVAAGVTRGQARYPVRPPTTTSAATTPTARRRPTNPRAMPRA